MFNFFATKISDDNRLNIATVAIDTVCFLSVLGCSLICLIIENVRRDTNNENETEENRNV
jgi:hypothetical protein